MREHPASLQLIADNRRSKDRETDLEHQDRLMGARYAQVGKKKTFVK